MIDDWLVFNVNICSISAISWREQILQINFHIYQTLRNKTLFINKGNNKITELRTILQRESQNS